MNVRKIKNTKILRKIGYAVLFMALGWWLHGKLTPGGWGGGWNNEPPHVLVRSLRKADVSAKKKYIAQVEAINSVDIVPQVSGYLEEILFKDGAYVEKGTNIFRIEQRKYKADLKAAEAAVKQLTTQYKRISSLNEKKFVSDKEFDAAESNLEQAEAALDLARLNMEYTEIKSPISGFIGKALVTQGNLVSPNTQKLARVVQVQPIRVVFSITDKERADFMQKAEEAKDIYIDVVLPNGQIETSTAQNLFFDNEVNPETATIPVYVDMANEDHQLVPGNYVDINIRFNSRQEAVLVPQVALSADVNGSYVMLVGENNIVEQRYLQLGEVIDDQQVALNGLDGSEKVIIQGLQKVYAGLKVNPTDVSSIAQ